MPHTEIRVSTYDGSLEELAQRYSPNFIQMPAAPWVKAKLGLCLREQDNFYLLMISQGVTPNTAYNYNVMMSVTGTNDVRTRQIAEDFFKKLGIETRPAPDFLKNLVGALDEHILCMAGRQRTSDSIGLN